MSPKLSKRLNLTPWCHQWLFLLLFTFIPSMFSSSWCYLLFLIPSFPFLLKFLFCFVLGRKWRHEGGWRRGVEAEGERENLKQTLHWAQNPKHRSLISQLWDHDLSRNQESMLGDPRVAQGFSTCLQPRVWSWSPRIESHIGSLYGACLSLCLCLCVSLSVSHE